MSLDFDDMEVAGNLNWSCSGSMQDQHPAS